MNMLVKIHVRGSSNQMSKKSSASNNYYSKSTPIGDAILDDFSDIGPVVPFTTSSSTTANDHHNSSNSSSSSTSSSSSASSASSWQQQQQQQQPYFSSSYHSTLKSDQAALTAYSSHYNSSYMNETGSYDTSNNTTMKLSPNTDLETLYSSSNNTKLAPLNELKSLHFILLLFSSFSTLDSFMYDCNNNAKSSYSNQIANQIDIEYFQKFILKLIDHVCKDDLMRTRILLSVPEIIEYI